MESTSTVVAPLSIETNSNPSSRRRSPTVPFTPITILDTEHGVELRQSSTNLAIVADIVDIDIHEHSSSHSHSNSVDTYDTYDVNHKSTRSISTTLFEADDLLLCLSDQHQQQLDDVLLKNGYSKLRKITNTLQGAMYEAKIIDPYKRKTTGFERVAIKQTSKILHDCGEAIQDDNLTVIVEENIVKEAMILKHLTKDNRPSGGYIAKFVDFFETYDNYYLVIEYVGDCNLQQFVTECHKYIKQKKLKLTDYKKVIKFLFWQICVVINWMHNDMKCCHSDLCLQNIMVRNGDFIVNKNTGHMTINPNIAVKIVDFGLAEIFHPLTSENEYTINKWGLKDSFQTTAPNVYNEFLYDAMKADIWSLGAMLYKLSTVGKSLYEIPDEDVDVGYESILNNTLKMYLQTHRVSKYFNKKSFDLMTNMLNVNETERYSVFDVLNHPWFETYYKKYAQRIKQKSKSQKIQLKNQTNKMRSFPYYSH